MEQSNKPVVNKVEDSIQINPIAEGPLPDPIADFIKLSSVEGDLLFWQWEQNSQIVEFYTSEKVAHKLNLQSLGEHITHLIASRINDLTRDDSCSEKHEIKMLGPQGEPIWKKISVLFFLGADGQVERAVGTVQDISNLKSIQLALENQLDFINTLLDGLNSPVFFKDEKLVYRHCNKAFEEYLGKSRKEILGKTVFQLCPPHLADIYQRADLELLEQRLPQIYQTKVRSADGNERNVIFNKSVVLNKKGKITGMIGIINDITERVQIENRLQRIMDIKDAIMEINRAAIDINTSEQFYAIVLDCILSAMKSAEICNFLILDSTGNLNMVAANGLSNVCEAPVSVELEKSIAWHAMAGKTKSCFCIEDIQAFSAHKCIESHALLQQLKIRSMLGAPIFNEGKLIGFITVCSRSINAYDETDLFVMEYVRTQIIQVLNRQFLYEKNVVLARYDSLTGLLNRRYFDELFEIHQKRAQRYDEKFHLVVIDLDNFKNINDQRGHLCGDAVLVDFAKQLTSSFRESDIICRFGGDEFLVVLIDITVNNLLHKIELLQKKLTTVPLIYQEESLPYSFSFGVAEWPADGANLDLLTCHADIEMYKNKRASKQQAKPNQSNNRMFTV
ncbi:MAG: diguanylate cyclase (GGDEF)-like protein/PAS domain S-box-containing protein [Psychromonas sp.]|jgi:diguanylate cyclase (GGDEF)-like protein/PAS domain S-box-containing protein|uniref:diguanylate cyclase domain-containing protein n=1 Tax=Psychromonas sp. TaxID=1884585 RepID=UPI0039E30F2E